MRASVHFGRVVEPGSGLSPSLIAEVSVNELYGDFRKASQPVGTMEIHFILYEAMGDAPLPLKLGDIVFAYIHNMLIMNDLDCTTSAVPLLPWGCEPLQHPFLLISFSSSKRCAANGATRSSLPDTEPARKISPACGN
jgi:hypothetical protein